MYSPNPSQRKDSPCWNQGAFAASHSIAEHPTLDIPSSDQSLLSLPKNKTRSSLLASCLQICIWPGSLVAFTHVATPTSATSHQPLAKRCHFPRTTDCSCAWTRAPQAVVHAHPHLLTISSTITLGSWLWFFHNPLITPSLGALWNAS